jgi:hypothetical protein
VSSGEIVIDPVFEGPPAIAHGGYTCGLLAGRLAGGRAAVTLRKPVRLGVPLRVEAAEGGLALYDGAALVAQAVPDAEPAGLGGPPPPTFAQAVAASAGFPGFDAHPYPRCVVCGPQRTDPDAFRIFPGPVTGGETVAAVWQPGRGASVGGAIRREFAWAALDCPAGWAAGVLGRVTGAMLLGRMTVWLVDRLPAADAYLVAGWWDGGSGRKHTAGSALYGRDGELLGVSRQTWIVPGANGVAR